MTLNKDRAAQAISKNAIALVKLENATGTSKFIVRKTAAAGAFKASIKQLTVNETVHVHGKGAKAVVLSTFRRLSLSVNEEAENLKSAFFLKSDHLHRLRSGKLSRIFAFTPQGGYFEGMIKQINIKIQNNRIEAATVELLKL